MIKRLLAATALSTSVIFLVPGVAFAQPGYNWTGFYAGLGLGAGKSGSSLAYDYSGVEYTIPDNVDFTGGGPLVEAKVGHNWQSGNLVMGVEADVDALKFRGSLTGPNYTAEEQLHALLSLRGRVGVAFDRFLIFGTAGVAAGTAEFNTDVGKGSTVGDAGVVTGTVVGAGVEYAVTDKLSLSAGVKHYDLSPLTAVGDDGKGGGYTATYNPHPTLFAAGINVHF